MVVVAAGMATAVGLIGLVVSVRVPSRRISDVFAALDSVPAGLRGDRAAARSSPALPAWRLDRVLGGRVAGGAVPSRLARSMATDLTVTGTGIDDLCAQSIVGAFAGAALPPACWAVVALGGIDVSWTFPVWASVLLASLGAALPFLALPADARRARKEALRVVSSFLDLVVLCLAGGMGIEGALHASAGMGEHVMSRRIADAIASARDAGEAPWVALDVLGRRIGVDELIELGAALSLAGREGSRIRATLSAKASAMRKRELAAAETEANKLTERLFLPGTFLLVGFLLFIGYPAVARIVGGL